jgi:hypothetical protein
MNLSPSSTSCTGGATLKFHEFARKRGWVNPTDSHDTSLMYTYGTGKDLFTWVQDSGYGKHINDYLGGYNLGRPRWMDPGVYPVRERLVDGANRSPDAPFLVDIGGNVGHDLARFHSRYPDAPGKLILQDLPMMIRQIKDLDQAIIRMEYDFHQEQPVKGKSEDLFISHSYSCLSLTYVQGLGPTISIQPYTTGLTMYVKAYLHRLKRPWNQAIADY